MNQSTIQAKSQLNGRYEALNQPIKRNNRIINKSKSNQSINQSINRTIEHQPNH